MSAGGSRPVFNAGERSGGSWSSQTVNGSSPCGQINTESNKRVAALVGLSVPSLLKVSCSGLWFSPGVDFGWFCRSLGLRRRLSDSVSLLFFKVLPVKRS